MAPWDLHFTLGFALVTDIATDGHEAMKPFECLHKGFAAGLEDIHRSSSE